MKMKEFEGEIKEKLEKKSVRVFCPTNDKNFKNVLDAVIDAVQKKFNVLNESRDDFCCLCSFEGKMPDIAIFHPEYGEDGYNFDPRCFSAIKETIKKNKEVKFIFLVNFLGSPDQNEICEFPNVFSLQVDERGHGSLIEELINN